MKKRIVCFVLIMVMAMGFMPTLSFAASSGEFAGGSGTESDPYLITNKTHLNNVRNHRNAHFKMTCDIEFTDADFAEGGAFYNDGQGWSPIGTDYDNPFTGTFDGNGYAVKNLYINISSDSTVYAGLFGYNKGTIKNLGMEDGAVSVDIYSDLYSHYAIASGIAGSDDGGTIENCYNTCNVSASSTCAYAAAYAIAGGIVGRTSTKSTITNCYNIGDVLATDSTSSSGSSSSHAGGIVGENTYSTIENCYNIGTVSATSTSKYLGVYVGGIAGNNWYSTIENCYNTGDVSATASSSSYYVRAGGIAGVNSSFIANCYNTGSVSSTSRAGGIAGENSASITNCYNTGKVSVSASYSSSEISSAVVGGIVGENSGTIENCYNTGDVSASSMATVLPNAWSGGIAGENDSGTIKNCYNISTVLATSSKNSYAYTGGIVGYDYNGTITNCYFLDNISIGVGSNNGSATTVKCTDTQLKEQATFAGFDFDSVWTFDATVQAYPILKGICYHHTFDNDCDITCNTCAFTRNGGHVWGDYVYNNDATTEKDGTKTRTCSACNEKETVTAEGTKLPAPTPDPAPEEKPAVEIIDTTTVFTDVKAGKWYTNAINYAYSNNFIAGVSKTEFGRDVPVTRGMFITILARIAGVDTSKASNKVDTKFTDVKSGKYYTAAIKWANENNIVSGLSDTAFGPETAIERQQLCTMIVNFAKFMKVDLTATQAEIVFADGGNIRKYAKTAVSTCQKAGIVSGYAVEGGTAFKPQNTATRAEAAQILYKFHKDFVA